MKKTPKRLLSILLLFLIVLPLVSVNALAADEPGDLNAKAVYLYDTRYKQVLYEKNAHEQRAPASITKVMTALLVFEAIGRGQLQPDTVITASENATGDLTKDSSTQNIQPGEQMTVQNLLYCLLCPSANEAANILAEAVSGSIPAFVEAMNARAAELGMNNTHFLNPHGLHQEGHYSSAYDLYLMCAQAMTNPLFQKIVATSSYTVPATNLSRARRFSNSNALISEAKYPGYAYNRATGVKTGYTPEAGYCLLSSAKKGERNLICVVLGADNPVDTKGNVKRLQFSESRTLLMWGIENFKAQTIISQDSILREVPVNFGKGVGHVVSIPSSSIEPLLPISYDKDKLTTDIKLTKERVSAPIKKGDVLGSVTVSYDGTHYGTVDLIAANDVSFSIFSLIATAIKAFFTGIWVWIALVAIVSVIVLRYLRALNRTPRRKQNTNIMHIDSAKGSIPSKPKKTKKTKAPPR